MNLGHGILPDTPIASVEALIEAVHAFDRGRTPTRAVHEPHDASTPRAARALRPARARATRPIRPRSSSTTASRDDVYVRAPGAADAPADEPLSVYVHLPFCEERCAFCGCNVVITPHRDVAEPLPRRARAGDRPAGARTCRDRRHDLAAALGRRHADLLHGRAARARLRAARAALHVHAGRRGRRRDRSARHHRRAARPRCAGSASTACRWACRTSSPRCRRRSTASRATSRRATLVDHARALGFALDQRRPHLRPAATRPSDGFAATLDQVLTLRPDRVAVYSFAFVPWMKAHMKQLDRDGAAGAELKLALLARAQSSVHRRGLPARSAWTTSRCPTTSWRAPSTARTLHRNFMGYTVQAATRHGGAGRVGDRRRAGRVRAEHQEAARVLRRRSTPGRFPIERGYALDDDDEIRRHVITELMCNFHLDVAERRAAVRHRLRRVLRRRARRADGARIRPSPTAWSRCGRTRIDVHAGRPDVRAQHLHGVRPVPARAHRRAQAGLQPHGMTRAARRGRRAAASPASSPAFTLQRRGARAAARRCRSPCSKPAPRAGGHAQHDRRGRVRRSSAGPNGFLDREPRDAGAGRRCSDCAIGSSKRAPRARRGASSCSGGALAPGARLARRRC